MNTNPATMEVPAKLGTDRGQALHFTPHENGGPYDSLSVMAKVLAHAGRESFGSECAAQVAGRFGVSHVLLAEYGGYPVRKLHITGQWHQETWLGPTSFTPVGTPIDRVLESDGAAVWIEEQAASQLAALPDLQTFAPEGFVAAPLRDTVGNPIGVLALGHNEPFPRCASTLLELEVFASIAAGELSRVRADREARFLVSDLRQRMRELSCFYGLTEALRTREEFRDVCGDLVRLMPEAWQHPDIARARVMLDGDEFVTQPFQNTPWGMSAAVVAGGRVRGSVQVFYVEDRYEAELGGPFLPAERNLLDALARTLGEAIEKREAETAIREQSAMLARERNRLETVLRSIADGVVVTDDDNRIMLMNPAASALLGVDAEVVLGLDFLGLIEDESFRMDWRRTAEEEAELVKQDLRIERPVARALNATRSRVPHLAQGMGGYVTILHDVTREREIEQMKSDFVSSISHELRTPMTSIRGFASTLLRKPDMDEARRQRFLTIISEESDRLLAMIEELLLISRLESGPIVMEAGQVDIAQLIQRACAALEHEIANKELNLTLAIEDGLPIVAGDGEKLRIVMSNLIENAVKFTEEGGHITVRAFTADGALHIEVEDSGIGIPERAQHQIFERFYRVHRPGATYPGTGLGLFIVHEIVKLHEGEIEVTSMSDQGSRFLVRLPLPGPAPAQPTGGLASEAQG